MGIWLLLGLSLFLQACGTPVRNTSPVASPMKPASAPALKHYVLGPGDEIQVSIWRYEELNRTVLIDPSGSIHLPLAGEVMAVGKTVPALQSEIVRKLSQYIVKPRVDVNISKAENNRIYVLGEVRDPGSITIHGRSLVWDALARAGGLTDDANADKAFLIHPLETNDAERVEVVGIHFKNFRAGDVAAPSYIQNGDILYVPEKRIASVEKFMLRLNNILAPIIGIERMIVLGPQVVDVLEGKESTTDFIVSP